MATIRVANDARNAAVDAVVDKVDAGPAAGYIEIRSGTQPANANTAATGTVLVTFTLADPAFGNAGATTQGVADLDADPDISATAANTGTATWGRVYDSTGAAVFDGDVASSGTPAFTINTTSVTSGQTVTLTAGTVTFPAA